MRTPFLISVLVLTATMLVGRPSDGSLTVYPLDPSFDPYVGLDYSEAFRIERYAGHPYTSRADGVGSLAEICGYVGGIATDGTGGVFFTENQSHTIRHMDAAGTMSTVAGMPFVLGNTPGKGSAARMYAPIGLVRTSKGDYLFADMGNDTLSRLSADGTVSNFATLYMDPMAMAIDTSDNLYLLSADRHAVYMISAGDPQREPRLIAGAERESGDVDGAARFARFEYPSSIAVGSDGVVYIADKSYSRIRTLSPDGIVRTLVSLIPKPVDGVMRGGNFFGASSMTWHPSGFLVIGSGYNIAKVTPSGEVSNIAGRQDNYADGLYMRDGQGRYATFSSIQSIAIDGDGSLLVADNGAIRRVTLDGNVSTLAGSGSWGVIDGFADFARFQSLQNLCTDASGNVYVTGGFINQIKRIGADMMVDTIPIRAGSTAGYDAIIYHAQDNSLYLGNSHGEIIRVGLDGQQELFLSVPGMTSCVGLVFGPKGELYISDAIQHVVWRCGSDKKLVIVAGKWQQPGYADGPLGVGTLHCPEGIALDKSGNLFIADTSNQTVRKLSVDGTLSTLAGSPGAIGRQDGFGASARFDQPQTLCIDDEGNLFLSDSLNMIIRRITPSGRVSTVGGSFLQNAMIPGMGRDGSSIGSCDGVCISPDGYLFVASNTCVVRLSPANRVLPKYQEPKATEGAVFNVVPRVATARLQWYHGDQAIPGATGAELFIPTLVKANEGLYSVSIDGVRTANAELVVHPVPIITVAPVGPSTASMAGAALSLSVQAVGDGLRYQWRKNGVALAGATSAEFTVDRLHLADAGSYDVVVSNDFGGVVSAAIPVSVTPLTSMSNLSTRSPVLGGDSVQIVGFAISGTAEKTLLIRAAGPGLGLFGLSDCLKDPQLDLYDSGGRILASNNDWSADASAALRIVQSASELGAFAFTQGSKDAALLVTLKPGLYTAMVKGADQGSGINLIEVYGTGEVTDSQLSNLSTRSMVQTESSVQIGGFVISGPNSKRVLLRASGPSLATVFELDGVLADPVLDLYDESNTPVTSNDNWSSDATAADALSAAGNRLGAFAWPKGSLDAGILVTLKPGRYTAIVHGKGTATGIALLELYDAD